MKKHRLPLLLFTILSFGSFAQNTFPANGNVGIGTTSPNTVLSIQNNTNKSDNQLHSLLELKTNESYEYTPFKLEIDVTGGPSLATRSYSLNTSDHGLAWGGNLVFQQFDGNVGIGIQAPTRKLEVVGNAGSAGLVRIGGSLDYGNGVVLNVAPGNIFFDAPNFSGGRLSILGSNGNVGIGTASPDAKLAVNGTIHSKEVKVDLNNFPDYVFRPNYLLRPLTEVEAYIKTEGHLPEVPSAAEVAKNGINVGETESLLLKKIEELTLYLIDKDRSITAMQKQLLDQQQKLNSQQAQLGRLDKNRVIVKQINSYQNE